MSPEAACPRLSASRHGRSPADLLQAETVEFERTSASRRFVARTAPATTRSRLTPRPMKRPGIAQRGKRSSSRTSSGARIGAPAEQAADDAVLRGLLRGLDDPGREQPPLLHLVRAADRRPRPGRAGRRGSWRPRPRPGSARLMPIPPIGDMAWAASPIASRPGRCQQVSRSSLTVSKCRSADVVELGEVELRRRPRRLPRGSPRSRAPDRPRPRPWG